MFVKKSWCNVKGKRYYAYKIEENYRSSRVEPTWFTNLD